MRPGGSVRGQVTITNTGGATGVVHLSKTSLVDTPGPRGGSLSKRLELRVEEVTGGRARRFYRGRLGGMPTLPLGSISPRQARTYRFTVSFPRGVPTATGARDNAYQGSSVRVGYLWRAKEEVERAAGRRIQGTAGDETLVGTPGNDLIVCGGGRDRVEARGGSDVVRCGSGENLIDGAAGDDRVFGGSGRDVIAGGPGDDELFGGSGYDRLVGGPGDDRLDGRFERGPRRP